MLSRAAIVTHLVVVELDVGESVRVVIVGPPLVRPRAVDLG